MQKLKRKAQESIESSTTAESKQEQSNKKQKLETQQKEG